MSELAGEVFGSKKVKDCDEISLCHFEGRVYFAILQLDEKIKKKTFYHSRRESIDF